MTRVFVTQTNLLFYLYKFFVFKFFILPQFFLAVFTIYFRSIFLLSYSHRNTQNHTLSFTLPFSLTTQTPPLTHTFLLLSLTLPTSPSPSHSHSLFPTYTQENVLCIFHIFFIQRSKALEWMLFRR